MVEDIVAPLRSSCPEGLYEMSSNKLGAGQCRLSSAGGTKKGGMSVKLGEDAAACGTGIFARIAGTAAMTLSSTIEMKVRGRPASSTPAQAAAKVLGVEPVDE